MPLLIFDRRPPERKLRQFALCVVVLALAGLIARFRQPAGLRLDGVGIAFSVLALVGLAGLAKPALCRPLYVGLAVVTYPTGWVVSWVVLGLVFYGVFLPVGLLMRLAGRDPLQRRFKKQARSYWHPTGRARSLRSYFSQF